MFHLTNRDEIVEDVPDIDPKATAESEWVHLAEARREEIDLFISFYENADAEVLA